MNEVVWVAFLVLEDISQTAEYFGWRQLVRFHHIGLRSSGDSLVAVQSTNMGGCCPLVRKAWELKPLLGVFRLGWRFSFA